MNWLAVWLRTVLGVPHWPHWDQRDQAISNARMRQRDQALRLELLEREADTFRQQHPRPDPPSNGGHSW